jgi:hypothetical protein
MKAPDRLGPYRSTSSTVRRDLVVHNVPLRTAVNSGVTGFVLVVAGALLLPMTQLIPSIVGGEVALSGMGTVFVLVGLTLAGLGFRMRAGRTYLSIDADELLVRICDPRGPRREYRIAVDDVERVGVETSHDGLSPGYRAELRLRGGAAIPLGETLTASRGYYEEVAGEIRAFLT